ncbi:translin family protein [Abortiporus biennis]
MSVTETKSLSSRDAIVSMFETFRLELDEHNDRRERLIKSSRDVTNLSKKNDHAKTLKAASLAKERLQDIQKLFAGFKGELVRDNFWRYQRNVSPGLQEYIEALSFTHYLETGKLITYTEVQQSLCDNEAIPFFPLSLEDYLLGLSDLTGELMRYAISAISQRGGRSKASEVCSFVRNCKADFESMTPYFRELRKKQNVTSQSLEKIEDAAYALAVRSSEYDLPPEILDDLVQRAIINTTSGDGKRKRDREDEFEDDYNNS